MAESEGPPLFAGEPEHCSLCGEPGHTHDDHWLFDEVERVGLRAFEKQVSDDALVKECIRRGWGVIKPNEGAIMGTPEEAATAHLARIDATDVYGAAATKRATEEALFEASIFFGRIGRECTTRSRKLLARINVMRAKRKGQ